MTRSDQRGLILTEASWPSPSDLKFLCAARSSRPARALGRWANIPPAQTRPAARCSLRCPLRPLSRAFEEVDRGPAKLVLFVCQRDLDLGNISLRNAR